MQEIDIPVTWRDRLEELAGGRRDRWMIGTGVVAVVLLAVVVSGRGAPAQIAPPAMEAVVAPSTEPTGALESTVLVHVAGAVRHSGLYELPSGARVADAVAAAGGASRRGDLDLLNLAEILSDGQKILVPTRGGAATPAEGVSSSPAGPHIVNLNTASPAELETIPGIGPTKAAAIVSYREEVGLFTSVDQILEVAGIGPATLDAIRPYIAI
ncbi:MAG TPA: helix-hairpin-helix domain-containing protein [Actinomycetota bacterium]|nr:helix-hairpin-helix domain-containing protein [Actinomycetota bacterium]